MRPAPRPHHRRAPVRERHGAEEAVRRQPPWSCPPATRSLKVVAALFSKPVRDSHDGDVPPRAGILSLGHGDETAIIGPRWQRERAAHDAFSVATVRARDPEIASYHPRRRCD